MVYSTNTLLQHTGRSLGTYQNVPVYPFSSSDPTGISNCLEANNYVVIAETHQVVRKRNGEYWQFATLAENGNVTTISPTKRFFIPKGEKKEEEKEVIADVALADLIDKTLKGLTLDEMLKGFNYGLED